MSISGVFESMLGDVYCFMVLRSSLNVLRVSSYTYSMIMQLRRREVHNLPMCLRCMVLYEADDVRCYTSLSCPMVPASRYWRASLSTRPFDEFLCGLCNLCGGHYEARRLEGRCLCYDESLLERWWEGTPTNAREARLFRLDDDHRGYDPSLLERFVDGSIRSRRERSRERRRMLQEEINTMEPVAVDDERSDVDLYLFGEVNAIAAAEDGPIPVASETSS